LIPGGIEEGAEKEKAQSNDQAFNVWCARQDESGHWEDILLLP
jgi:hypothetical protein